MRAFAKAIKNGQDKHLFAHWLNGVFRFDGADLLRLAQAANVHIFNGAFRIVAKGQENTLASLDRVIVLSEGVPRDRRRACGVYIYRDADSHGFVHVKRGMSPRNALHTLVHEMVHAYVHIVDKKAKHGHGPLFFAWTEKCAEFGMELTELEEDSSLGVKKISPHYLVHYTDLGYPVALGVTRNAVCAQAWAGLYAHHHENVFVSVVTSVDEKVRRLVGYPSAKSSVRHRPVSNVGREQVAIHRKLYAHTKGEGAQERVTHFTVYGKVLPGRKPYLVDKSALDNAVAHAPDDEVGIWEILKTHPATINLTLDFWEGKIQ